MQINTLDIIYCPPSGFTMLEHEKLQKELFDVTEQHERLQNAIKEFSTAYEYVQAVHKALAATQSATGDAVME